MLQRLVTPLFETFTHVRKFRSYLWRDKENGLLTKKSKISYLDITLITDKKSNQCVYNSLVEFCGRPDEKSNITLTEVINSINVTEIEHILVASRIFLN